VRATVAALTLMLVVPALAAAEGGNQSPWEVTLGGGLGYTTGYTTWNIAASSGSPNVLSELTWRGVDAIVTDVNAQAVWKRLVLQGALGVGPIVGGAFIDNDFAADDRQDRFSATRSDVENSALVYANVDVGFRLVSWNQPQSQVRGYVDAFTGYQVWYEYYEAVGANGTTSISSSQTVVEEAFLFQSIRLGLQAQVPLYRGLGLRFRGAYLPWTAAYLWDNHPLRGDLDQDPSFEGSADGGHGYQLEGALTYELGNRFSVEVGYRYWRIDSGSGTQTAHTTSGELKSRLNEIIIERYGPWAGVKYRF
jgi:hypothetical protein